MIKDYKSLVVSNKKIADEIYKTTFAVNELPGIIPGQFANVRLPDSGKILRRPIGVADYNVKDNTFDIIYRIRGAGTALLAEVKAGAVLDVLLPLGNGFEIQPNHRKIMLIGGGTGTAVFPAVATAFPEREIHLYAGFSTAGFIFVKEQKSRVKSLVITTDDGSFGIRGNVVAKALEDIPKIKPDVIFCCGPDIVYKLLKAGLGKGAPPAFISLEGRMCCGFGVCFVCACKIRRRGEIKTFRVCRNGPVFDINDWVED